MSQTSDGRSIWNTKGATLSHNNACKEYELTEEQIYEAMRTGQLQYRQGNVYGNPFFRVLRHEVEELAKEVHGADRVQTQLKEKELADVNKELRRLRKRVAELEDKKSELMKTLDS